MNRRQRFYGWTLIGVLATFNMFIAAFPFSGGSVINGFMVESMDMNRSALGLAGALSSLAVGIVAPLVSWVVNKWGARFSLSLGSMIILASATLMGFAVSETWHFVVVYGVVLGLGIAFVSSLTVQTVITHWFHKRRGLATSIVLASGGLGAFIATNLLNYVVTSSGNRWQAGWIVIMITTAFCALLAMLLVRNKPADLGQLVDGGQDPGTSSQRTRVHRVKAEWAVRDVLRTPAFWLITLASIGFMVPITVNSAHTVMHLRSLGHSPELAAMTLGLMSMIGLVIRLLTGALVDFVEPRIIWPIAMLFIAASMIALSNAYSVPMVYLSAGLYGIGFGGSYICYANTLGNYYGPKAFASLMGIVMAISTIVGSAAPYLSGVIFDTRGSYNLAFTAIAVLEVIGAVGIAFARPPQVRESAEQTQGI